MGQLFRGLLALGLLALVVGCSQEPAAVTRCSHEIQGVPPIGRWTNGLRWGWGGSPSEIQGSIKRVEVTCFPVMSAVSGRRGRDVTFTVAATVYYAIKITDAARYEPGYPYKGRVVLEAVTVDGAVLEEAHKEVSVVRGEWSVSAKWPEIGAAELEQLSFVRARWERAE